MNPYIGQTILYLAQDGDNVSPQAAVVTNVIDDAGTVNAFVHIFGGVRTDIPYGDGTLAGCWTELVIPTLPTT